MSYIKVDIQYLDTRSIYLCLEDYASDNNFSYNLRDNHQLTLASDFYSILCEF